MNKRNSIQIYFCIAVLSIISLFWLISSTFRTNIGNGSYQNTDPDSLLFARYLEQSILKGNIQTSDSYSAFPYKIETGFAQYRQSESAGTLKAVGGVLGGGQ